MRLGQTLVTGVRGRSSLKESPFIVRVGVDTSFLQIAGMRVLVSLGAGPQVAADISGRVLLWSALGHICKLNLNLLDSRKLNF